MKQPDAFSCSWIPRNEILGHGRCDAVAPVRGHAGTAGTPESDDRPLHLSMQHDQAWSTKSVSCLYFADKRYAGHAVILLDDGGRWIFG